MARKPRTQATPAAAPAQPRLSRCESIGIDGIVDRIVDGKKLREIAAEIGITVYAMHHWLKAEPQRKAKYEAALRASADWHAEQAAAVIEALPKDATPAEMMQARELAQQHRWMAKMRDGNRFGDKLQLDHNVTPDAAEALGELRALFGLRPQA